MKYEIDVDQRTGLLIPKVTITEGNPVNKVTEIISDPMKSRKEAISWIVQRLKDLNPEGTCRLTRKKVYNERVVGRPGFWEITAYNARGEYLGSAQWSDVMQEGYLRGLVANRFGFPLEAAEIIS